MTYVVPHVSSGLIVGGELESPLQAADGHVVLLGVETAETEVSKQLCVIHTNLKKPSGGGRRKWEKVEYHHTKSLFTFSVKYAVHPIFEFKLIEK